FDIERTPVAQVANISPAYFSVLGAPLISGRFFTDSDDIKGQPVALIDETLTRRFWPDADPVGQRVRLGVPNPRDSNNPQNAAQPWLTIVGVVGNIRTDGFEAVIAPHIYRPAYQAPPYAAVVYLRTSSEPGPLGEAVRAQVQRVDPTIPVFSVRTMDFIVSTFLAERRFALELLGIFACAALVLASIGIYGVMAYTFSRRTNEIGIRIAMGAKRSDILKMALGEGTVTIAFGLAGGLLGSLVLTRFLQSMLFSVKPTDPV